MPIRIVLPASMVRRRHEVTPLEVIAGKPLVARCLERLIAARAAGGVAWQLVVVTTSDSEDDPIAELAAAHGQRCTRVLQSDELSLLTRAVTDLASQDILVRASIDQPLCCPTRTLKLVSEFIASRTDYRGHEAALGVLPDVLTVGTVRKLALCDDLDDAGRRQISHYFRRPGIAFRTRLLPPNWAGLNPTRSLLVQTKAQAAAVNRLYAELISLAGHDRPETWTLEQIYGAVEGLLRRRRPAAPAGPEQPAAGRRQGPAQAKSSIGAA